MKFFMRSKEQISFIEIIDSKLFIPALRSRTAGDAIAELSEIAAQKIKLDGDTIAERVLERERLMSTGIGDQVAVPHARLSEVQKSSVVIGISEEGIDFNAYDGKPAHLIFLILTPLSDPDAQIQLLCEISSIFQQRDIREEILHSTSFSEFMSAVKMGYYMNPNICAAPIDTDRLRRESPEKRQG
jgi:mannitol/fructose-specific phosphotransferase system IIA component (Ntr-type)